MNQINKRQEPNLPQKIRENHKPEKGDIYLKQRFTDEQCIIRLEEKTGHCWKVKRYDFSEEDFTREHYSLTDNDLKDGNYRLLLHPLQEILNQAARIFEGVMPEDTPLSDSTELIRSGRERLLAMKDEAQMKEDLVISVKTVMQARINCIRQKMEERMRTLQPVLDSLERQAEIIEQVLSWLHAYLGDGVEVQTITTGEGAPKREPLTIRQRILFMDEEMAVIGNDGQGLDYTGKETFYEWLKNPANRDIILPEERCTVVMKPKRYSHRYTGDTYTNSCINRLNRHSFIVIRDGENIHVIESEDLNIYGAAIPTKRQYENIRESRCRDESLIQDETRNLQSRTMFYMMLLQGLADNTDIMGSHAGINIMKEENIRIIFDAEQDSMIGTGIKPWKEWMNERQKDIKRGDRIIFRANSNGDGTFLRIYYNKWSEPDRPTSGLYSVDKAKDGRLVFRYCPGDKVFNQSEGYYTDRKNRVSYVFDRWSAINFDTTDLDELEMYLKDRTQREHYADIIGLLLKMRDIKREEKRMESHFINLMTEDILRERKNIDRDLLKKTIEDVVIWWKSKVIFKRPLSDDDAKAWRMIRQKTLNTITI